MTSTFPSILSNYTNPNATNRLNTPSHSGIETDQNSGLQQVEAVIGVEGASSVVGSFQYLIKSPASNGGGHVQTANKGGTGQTSFSKGDILIAQSSSVLTKLALGNDAAILTADSTTTTGVKWGQAQPGIPTASIFTTPSTLAWVKPSVFSYIVVQVQGGGGGGGGEVSTGSPGASGAGGGGGGYAWKIYTSSMLANTPSVLLVIASTASGGVSGDNDGAAGNPTTFSAGATIPSIKGGGGGLGTKGSTGTPGAGGIASGGDFNLNGGIGGGGIAWAGATIGGIGGDSFWGHGGRPQAQGTGNDGSGYGGGGQGGSNISANAAGGTGSGGAIVLTIY